MTIKIRDGPIGDAGSVIAHSDSTECGLAPSRYIPTVIIFGVNSHLDGVNKTCAAGLA